MKKQCLKKECERSNQRISITALKAAKLWFQSRQSYRPTDTGQALCKSI
ncbi:hypothetical protein [Brunnivagina elsteri]|nr:hypothetical protein [Calothrix elsteri]